MTKQRNRVYYELSSACMQEVQGKFAKSDLAFFTFITTACVTLLQRCFSFRQQALVCPAIQTNPASGDQPNQDAAWHQLDIQVAKEATFRNVLESAKENILYLARFPNANVIHLDSNSNETIEWGIRHSSIQYIHPEQLQKFDFFLTTDASGKLEIAYDPEKFTSDFCLRFAQYLEKILNAGCGNLEVPIGAIELLSLTEIEQQLQVFNNTHTDYPKEETIPALFGNQVSKNPDQVALEFGQQKISYKALHIASDRIRDYLSEQHVGQGDVVAVLADRSPEMIATVLGVLKCGATYLPLHPTFPPDRVQFMLQDAQCRWCIGQQKYQSLVGTGVVFLDVEKVEESSPAQAPAILNTVSSDIAYIIYTSGSTGNPKGTQIRHFSVTRVVKDTNYISIVPEDRILQFANVAFDGSVFEIFGALLNGATLVLYPFEGNVEIDAFCSFFVSGKVSIAFLTTAFFNVVIDHAPGTFASVRKILFGGERVSVSHVSKAFESMGPNKLIHVYGPTESTVFATAFGVNTMPSEKTVPIGGPISNTEAIILDQSDQLVPIGGIGELCLAGDGLTTGYLNRPDLNKEKFLELQKMEGKRWYRSGDLASMDESGQIDCLGRIDDQVKLRGFRIELGEIETRMRAFSGIDEALVLVHGEGSSDKELRAYFTGIKNTVIPDLKLFLQKKLPEYMIPSQMIWIPEMPLTPNGKVDKKALIKAKAPSDKPMVAPRNDLDTKILEIWTAILNIGEPISIRDNFFEIGGHSLKGTMVCSEIYKTLGLNVPVKTLFLYPTILEFSDQLTLLESKKPDPIPVVSGKERYPLSSAQKRLFIIDQFDHVGTAYNMPVVLNVEGDFDRKKLETAVRKLIARHSVFRTRFELVEGIPQQIIAPDSEFKVLYYEAPAGSEQEMITSFIQPFDLEKAPLFRVGLIRQEQHKHILLFDMHHIISDGMSMEILASDFFRYYSGAELEPLPLGYKDYAVWTNSQEQKIRLKKQEEGWLEILQGTLPVLDLPTDFYWPQTQQFEGENFEFVLDAVRTKKLKEYNVQTNSTMFITVLALYKLLLFKITGQNDLIVGTPVAGRVHPDLSGLIGMFVNTLPLRSAPDEEMTFAAFLQEVKNTTLHALDNQEVQLEELIPKLKVNHDPGRNALFDTIFSFQNSSVNADVSSDKVGNVVFSPYETEGSIAKFALSMDVGESGGELLCRINYATSLFTRSTIKMLASCFNQLLNEVLKNPDKTLKNCSLISAEEAERIMHQFNDTQVSYPKESGIGELFDQQVKKQGNRTAIVYKQEKLSYESLREKADQLTQELIHQGIRPGDRVAIVMEKSVEMVVGLLAVLRAGGICVPVKPDFPKERIQFMLKDAGCTCLLVNDTSPGSASDSNIGSINVSGIISVDPVSRAHMDLPQITGNHGAYIIYTSGSTGQPKGVLIEHHAITRLVLHTNFITVSGEDVFLQASSVGFDAALMEIWGALLNGAMLVVPDEKEMLDPVKLEQLLEKEKVTHAFFTTSWFHQLIDSGITVFKGLKHVLTGGEILLPEFANKLHRTYPELTITNGYGPTESVTFVSTQTIDQEYSGRIPIGKPISNSRIYIVNKAGEPVPPGIRGEIVIAGDGLARGYLNNPELTNEKFVVLPAIKEERVYKTGDTGRWLEDGTLDILGRTDDQVKVRGYRIELGEITSAVLKHPEIGQCLILPIKEQNRVTGLCGYYVSNQKNGPDPAALKLYLASKIPAYLIPDYLIRLAEFPLNANGKVDKQALPPVASAIPVGETNKDLPQNHIEEQLAGLFRDLLGLSDVGLTTSFFDLGGHSLKAMRLVAGISGVFGVELSLSQVFMNPSVRKLASCVALAEKDSLSQIPTLEPAHDYAVSFAQQRMWVASQMDGSSKVYNMPMVFEISGEFNPDIFMEIFPQLVQRHESLRTSFTMNQGELRQRIIPAESVRETIRFFDFSAISPKEAELQMHELTTQNTGHQFDLEAGPLFVARLVREAKQKHRLLLNLHHIVFDGWSMEVLMKDAMELYTARIRGDLAPLPSLQIQYKDFAAWQNERIVQNQKKYLDFWNEKLSGIHKNNELSTDRPRPAIKSYRGAFYGFDLDPELSGKLKSLAGRHQVGDFVIIQAMLLSLIYRYTGDEKIVIGTPFAGRVNEQLENQIGFYINTLPLPHQITGSVSFENLLLQVRQTTTEVMDHQIFPFDKIVEALGIKSDPSHMPLFDIGLTWQDLSTLFTVQKEVTPSQIQPGDQRADQLVFSICSQESETAKYDLWLYGTFSDGMYRLSFEYNSDLFDTETIQTFAESLAKIGQEVAFCPDVELSGIALFDVENPTANPDTSFDFSF